MEIFTPGIELEDRRGEDVGRVVADELERVVAVALR